MEKPKNGYTLKRGEGTQINFRGTTMILKDVGEQTDDAYSLIEMLHPANVGLRSIFTRAGRKPFMC